MKPQPSRPGNSALERTRHEVSSQECKAPRNPQADTPRTHQGAHRLPGRSHPSDRQEPRGHRQEGGTEAQQATGCLPQPRLSVLDCGTRHGSKEVTDNLEGPPEGDPSLYPILSTPKRTKIMEDPRKNTLRYLQGELVLELQLNLLEDEREFLELDEPFFEDDDPEFMELNFDQQTK